MILSLLVIDDFLHIDDWRVWRQLALDAEYRTYEHTDGYSYANIGIVPDGLTLAGWIGRALLRPGPVHEHLQYFRRGEPGDGAGNIHVDNGEGEWASVFYLNDTDELSATKSGTAFWRHRWIGEDGLPSKQVEPELIQLLNEDRSDPDKWELRHVVPAKPNRIIIYPTHLFHSRWPLEPQPGRLVHTSFFT